jgi:hypothetical protein
MRLAGKICGICKAYLPEPVTQGEKYCAHCLADRRPSHRVYMNYMVRESWHCSFLEEDLKTSLPKKLTFQSHAKIFELAERGGCALNLEARQAIEHGIEIGRGGIWLQLTEEQYQKLKRP